MTAKKSRKKVLDHDPLAWLGEEKKKGTKKAAKKATTRKKPAKSAGAKTQKAASKVTGKETKVRSESVIAVAETQQPTVESEVTENLHFGFFDDDNSADKAVDQSENSCNGNVIDLGESLTIKTVADVKRRIEQCLMQQQDLALDSADLQKIDTSGLQMLFSLRKSLAQSHQQLNWKFRNPVIDSAAKLCGLEEIVAGPAEVATQQDSSTGSATDQGFGFF